MLKIVHVESSPAASGHIVALTGERLSERVYHSALLRCAGYRFAVDAVLARDLEAPVPSVVVSLLGDDSPQVGMVLHPADAPLTDEELSAAVQHLLMVPRLLKSLDALGVLGRLDRVSALEAPEVRFAGFMVQNLALQLSRLTLPTDAGLQQAERFKAELLAAC